MSTTPVIEVFFHGNVGRIQGKYYRSEDKNAPVALIIHPDPTHGGSMENKVVLTAFKSFIKSKCSVLRINLRGVGKSEGTFDNGNGEILDASVALNWLQAKHPDASHFWVVGYSFGSWIAANLMMRRPEIEGSILIAPLLTFSSLGKYDYSFLSPLPCSSFIISGSEDKYVKATNVTSFIESINGQNNNLLENIVIEGADHTFVNHLEQLSKVIDDYLNVRLATRIRKPVRKKRRRRKKKNSEI